MSPRPHSLFKNLLRPLFIAVIVCWPAQFAAADVFEIKNIGVDVKADTAAKARQQALTQAERRAFYALISRLTLTAVSYTHLTLPTILRV